MGRLTIKEFMGVVGDALKSNKIKLAYRPSKRYLDEVVEEYKELITFAFLFKICCPDDWLEYRTDGETAYLVACSSVSEDTVTKIRQVTSWHGTDLRHCLLIANNDNATMGGWAPSFTLFDVFVKDEYYDCNAIADSPIFVGTDIFKIDGKTYEVTEFADSELFDFVKWKFATLDCGYYFLHLDEAYKIARDAIHEYHKHSTTWLIQDYISTED